MGVQALSHTDYSDGMTPSECSTCGLAVIAGVTNVQRIYTRWVTWRLCKCCHAEETARHAREAAADKSTLSQATNQTPTVARQSKSHSPARVSGQLLAGHTQREQGNPFYDGDAD